MVFATTARSFRRRMRKSTPRHVAAERLEDRVLLSSSNGEDTEIRLNEHTRNWQGSIINANQATAALPEGGFVSVWTSLLQDGSSFGVYGQRVDANGDKAGPEFRINQTTQRSQRGPSVDVADDGRFVVVWQSHRQDGSNFGVYSRIYNADGTAATDEFRVNHYTTAMQENADVAFLDNGNVAYTWHGRGGTDYFGVFGRVFDANGQPVGKQFRATNFTKGRQENPVIAGDSTGGFWIAWNGRGKDNHTSIYARRFSADGTKLHGEFRVNQYRKHVQMWPTLAASDDGRVIVGWASQQDRGPSWGIYGRLYSSEGQSLSSEFPVNNYTKGPQVRPSVGFLSNGGFVFVWSGRGYGDRSGVFARHFDRNGNPQGREELVNTTVDDLQARPSVATGAGGYVVSWGGRGDGDNRGRFARFVTVNSPPQLEPIADQLGFPGDELRFSVQASDADLPEDTLTFSLGPNAPNGAAIDSATGEFTWTPALDAAGTDVELQVIVADAAGATDSENFTVRVETCPIQADSWTVTESGGSDLNRGGVSFAGCEATLTEGDSFLVAMATSFVVPANPTTINFTYAAPGFDGTDSGFINDAFEVALLDRDSNSLVKSFAPNTDAFFNITETQGVANGDDVSRNGRTVTLDISEVTPGETATFAFRLANNDADTETSIRIVDVDVPGSLSAVTETEGFTGVQDRPEEAQHRIVTDTPDEPSLHGPVTVTVGQVVTPSGTGDPQPLTPELEWVTDSFEIRPDSRQVMMTPAVIDLNQDSIPDVIFSTFSGGSYNSNGLLRVISGLDGSHLWTLNDSRYEVAGRGGVAVGDIDNDGFPEIIAQHESDVLMMVEHDGTVAWLSDPVGGINWGSAALADLDSDGTSEIIVGATVLNADGTIRWMGSSGRGFNGPGPLSAVADLDLDGQPEIVAGRTAYRSDGEVYWDASIGDGFPALGNFDSDAFPEIAVVTAGSVHLLEHDGTLIWTSSLPGGGSGGAPTVADFDGDGEPEIGVAGANRYVVFETDGTVKWSSPTQDGSSNVTGSSVFDFDSDGRAEVIYGDELFLRIYDGETGAELFRQAKGSGTTYELPVIVDVDADGVAEILAVANDYAFAPDGGQNGIYVWGDDENWSTTRQIWNQHTYHISNINDDGSIPRNELASWELYNNYRRNSQPTGTQLGRPLLTVTAPGADFLAGTQVVFSGRAEAQGVRSAGQPNAIEFVTINGRPVDVFDATGAFFTSVELLPGENDFVFVATDSVGQSVEATISVTGTQSDSAFDFSRFADTTGSFSGVYGRTSFVDNESMLRVDLATRNDGTFETDVPLLVGVRNISDPLVSVIDPDGFLPDGTPYYDFTDQIADGQLDPGELSGSPTITFSNPLRQQFDYELVYFGQLNEAPYITTVPKIEAPYDRDYAYNVDATDPNGDVINWRLATAPSGMTINAVSGEIAWRPTVDDLGLHNVELVADDGRGGIATQRYTVSVIEAPPNRPPVITSTPVTTAYVTSQFQDEVRDVDLSAWEVARLTTDQDEAPTWEVDVSGTSVKQQTNADASVFLSDFSLENNRIRGSWRVEDTGNSGMVDDDFMGFVFGYQDAGHFYLFDWKQTDQEFSPYGLGRRGMSVKVVNSDTELISGDLWPTNSSNSAVETLYHNDIPWSNFTDYSFDLTFREGRFTIVVSDGGTILDNIDIVDDTYTSGKFGFYNLSQGEVVYSGFTEAEISEETYRYPVLAVDPDDDQLTYSLVGGPGGMRVNSTTGVITWAPIADQIGNHDVIVEVADGNGGVATQEYVVCVHGDPTNHAPVIVTEPVSEATRESRGTLFVANDEWTLSDTGFAQSADTGRFVENLLTDFAGSESGKFLAISDSFALSQSQLAVTVTGLGHEWTVETAPTLDLETLQEYDGVFIAYFGSGSIDIGGIQSYLSGGGNVYLTFGSGSPAAEVARWSSLLETFGLTFPASSYNGIVGNVSIDSTHRYFAEVSSLYQNNGLNIAQAHLGQTTLVTTGGSGIYGISEPALKYQYDTDAIDPDNDDLKYSLATSPSGMTIDPQSGLVEWSVRNSGLSFDGVDDLVWIEDSQSLRPEDVTIEGWFNFDTASGQQLLIDKHLGDTFFDSYALWYSNGTLNGVISDNSGPGPFLTVPFTPEVGRWYHFAYTFEDAADSQRLFVDGVEVGQGTVTKSIDYDSDPLLLGASYDFNSPHDFFRGRMDEVRVWQIARTTNDIRDTMSTRISESPDLVATWSFDENEGTITQDASINRNNGVLGRNGVGDDLPTWVNSTAPIVIAGSYPVTVRVEDGRGGFDEQSFLIDVQDIGTGEISGTKRVADLSESVVFAHNFEAIVGDSIRSLIGPNATMTSNIVTGNGLRPPVGSTQHVNAPDGSNFASINTHTQLNEPTQEMSFSIWFNDRGDNGSDISHDLPSFARLLSSFSGTGLAADEVTFDLGPLDGSEERSLRFSAGGVTVATDGGVPVQDNRWHQAGFSFDSGTVTFFFDGQRLGSPLVLPGVVEIPAQSNQWFLIEDASSVSRPDEYYDGGSYDDAILWERALSSGEMELLATSSLKNLLSNGRFSDYAASTNLLPTDDTFGWESLDDTGGAAATVDDGSLTLSTGNFSTRSYFQQSAPVVDTTGPFFIEARVKYVSGATRNSAREPIVLGLTTESGVGSEFYIGEGSVFFTNGTLSAGPKASVNTMDAFHTYRVEYDGVGGVKAFYDGTEVLTGNTFASGGHGTQQRIFWGDGTDGASGVSEWEFVRHNALVDTNNVGWTIYLDQNQNGIRDIGERSTVTDADGNYEFTGLPEGTYYVREELQSGWVQTAPLSSYAIDVVADEIVDDIDFVNSRVVGSNGSPKITSTPLAEIEAGELFRYDAVATDPEHNALTFSLPLAPDGMTVHPTRGIVVWVPKEEQVGVHNVLLRATDESGATAVQSFAVTVNEVESAPIITSQPPTEVAAGQLFEYRLTAQDGNGDAVTFALEAAPDGADIEVVELTNSAGDVVKTFTRLTWLVPGDAAGTQPEFSVVASDGSEFDSQTFSLDVLSASTSNANPIIRSKPRSTARVGLEWTYLVDATDPNGDPLTYSLDAAPSGMTMTADGFISWMAPANAPASVPVEIRVSDGRGGETIQPFDLRIVSIENNDAPRITSVPRTQSVLDELYAYDPKAVDADGDEFVWSLTAAPRGMSIDSTTGAIRWVPDDQQLGTHIVAVTANDAFGGTFTQRYGLHVGCNNLAPAIVSVPPTVGLTDRLYLYAVRADDFEGDTLHWSLATAPTDMVIDSQSGVIRWTPTLSQIASHEVVIEVSDGRSTSTQAYTIVVSNSADPVDPNDPTKGTKGNRAPIITSTPVFGAEVDALYSYQVRGLDPEGDDFTFALGADAPAGMTINTDGLITWTPTAADVGDVLMTVTAVDEHGAVATQGYLLSVAVNSPPTIQSDAVTSATRGAAYRYSVRATDPEGDPLSWRLDDAPDGMTIDRFGRIVWGTAGAASDTVDVTVTVSDDRGQTDSDSWTITLNDDTAPPAVSFSVSSGGQIFNGDASVDIDSNYTVRVLATDNVGVTDIDLTVDGQSVTLNQDGTITLNAASLGLVSFVATATDAAGLTGTATVTVTVVDPARENQPVPTDPTLPPHPGVDPTDDNEPIVLITSPEIGSSVTNRVSIIGTVDDPEDNFWYYRVYYARADRVSITDIDVDDPDWIQINEGTEEVIDGELAVFDPSGLANDAYAVIVEAYDGNAEGYVRPTIFYVEGNVQVGNFRLDFTDLSVPLAGIPIEVTRVYDTVNAPDEGDFGFGWQLGVQDARILEVAAISIGGAFNPGSDKFIPDRTKVYLTNPSGQRVGFTYREELVSASFFGGIYRPYFEADPGVYDTLTIDETTVGRGGIIGDLTTGINPSAYTLTTKNNLRYRYLDTGELQKITDTNGNTVTFTPDGIQHSSGQSVDFIRDHRDRITHIIDPAGNEIVYEYDLDGDLVSVTNQASLATEYTYRNDREHFLSRAFDSRGKKVLQTQFNSRGEFVGVLDADGNRIDQRNFNTDANRGVIRDANGNKTTLIYNDRGNVTQEIDADGNTTFREYNDPANPDLETRIIDRRGFIIDRTYDARGNVLTISEIGTEAEPFAEPVMTGFTYDSMNNVTSITNAHNQSTRFKYDAQGNLTKITNALNDESSFTYDPNGRRETFTDFNGNTTTFEYTDPVQPDQPSKVIYADDTYQVFAYNQFGQVTVDESYEADGTLVERRETQYDNAGRVLAEISGVAGDADHPQTIVRRIYDGHLLDWEIIVHPDSVAADGTLLESPATPVDERLSRITDFEYDSADRVVRQIDAEGGIVDFRYDAQGNRVALRDPVGNITTWVYDSLNRVVEERDPFYWEDIRERDTVFASLTDDDFLDLVAPLVPVSAQNPGDPLYDDPSGADCDTNTGAEHIRLTCYDEEGNQSKTIDRNGRRREFDYDSAGRLLEELWFTADTSSLVETITFTYDDLGNMLTATDSNSNYLFEYDALNRLESVDNNPDEDRDVPRVILTYGYDAQGNVTMTQDDSGVTVESEYDERNRLAIRNWYDADGSGDVDDARVDFTYNAAGREATVRRYSDLTATTLVGSTTRTYDAAGRSDLLRHDDPVGALLASYDYDYDFSGLLIHEERDHQDSQYAQSIDYRYDLTGQLTDALFSGQDDEHYIYDANGNRITSEVGSDQRTYTTAPANQLESDGQFRYEYDGEGNQIKRVPILFDGSDDPSGTVRTFIYDHRNRLVQVDDWSSDPGDPQNPAAGAILTQNVVYTYGSLDRRIARDVDAEGPQEVNSVSFVYNGENAWADVNDLGVVERRYLFRNAVDGNIIEFSTLGARWLLVDALGSVRTTLSASGLAESVNYSTFGIRSDPEVSLNTSYGFTGREPDTLTGLTFHRARYVDNSLGRFVSNDPISFRGGAANLFQYANNDPVRFRDPSGTTAILQYLQAGGGLNSSHQGPAASLIGLLHGVSVGGISFIGNFLATGDIQTAFNATEKHLNGIVCGLKGLSTLDTAANTVTKVKVLGAYVSGTKLKVSPDVVYPLLGNYFLPLGAAAKLSCAPSSITLEQTHDHGGFENGANLYLEYLRRNFGLG